MLRGGLRLPHGTDVYLTGGEPDVALPPVEESQEEVHIVIDDVALPMQHESAVVSLAGRDLREGHHRVEIEGIARVFSTVRTLGHTAPTPIPAVGHSIRVDKSELRPASLDARVQAGGDEREDEILVTGATVRCVEGVLGVTRPPLVLPVKALRRTLLGAGAGEIEEPLAPERPAWMTQYGLQYRVFEHTPGFTVVWVIIVSEWRGAEIRSVDSTREPEGTSPGAAEERALAWCEAIRSVEGPVDPASEGSGSATPRSPRTWFVDHDLLLEWVSERGGGSWEQFKTAYDWLMPTRQRAEWMTAGFAARMLATLGHLEIDWQARRWAAAPPVLTLLPSAGAHALLTGGRTRTLMDELEIALEDHQDLYAVPPMPAGTRSKCPRHRLQRRETAIQELASDLGISYEHQ